MADINEIVDRQRAALAARDKALLDQISNDYKNVSARILADWQDISRRIREAQDAGEDFSPSWLFRQARLSDLLAQAQAEFARFSSKATARTTAEQLVELNMSQFHFREMVLPQLKDAGAFGVTFNRLPTRAVEGIVGRSSDGSPLKDLFDKLGPTFGVNLRDELIQAVAIGQAPRTTARRVTDLLAGNEARAQLIARTETIQAYREGGHLTSIENKDVLDGWTWITALDGRACAACVALNGSFHAIDERMAAHPACRCTKRFETKTFAELGIGGIGETKPPPVETGPAWFANVSRGTQELILGKRGAAAYRDGTVTLQNFVGLRRDSRWGPSYFQRAFKDAIVGPQPGVFIDYPVEGLLVGKPKPPPPAPAITPAKTPAITPATPAELTAAEARAELDRLAAARTTAEKDLQELDDRLWKEKQAWREKYPILDERRKFPEYVEMERLQKEAEDKLEAIRKGYMDSLRNVLKVADPMDFASVKYIPSFQALRADVQARIVEGVEDFKLFVSKKVQPALNHLIVKNTNTGRSFQSDFSIHMSEYATRGETVHELGHWLEENNSAIHKRILDFFEARTKDDVLHKLKDLQPEKNFDPWEVVKLDKFIDQYMGKWYVRNADLTKVVDRDFNQYATEVLSMGLQLFFENPVKLAAGDPEYFDMIYNVVRGIEESAGKVTALPKPALPSDKWLKDLFKK